MKDNFILRIRGLKTAYDKFLYSIYLSEQGLADESYQSSGFQDQSSENLNQSSGSERSRHNQSADLCNQSSTSDLPTDLSSTSDSAFETGNGSSMSESDSFLSNDAENDVMIIRSRDPRKSQIFATATHTVMTSSDDEDETIDVD